MQLDADKSNCGFFDDEHFYSYWFAIRRNKDVHLLGSQLMPLDAADLDGSGRTEWVFQSSRGEDEDGYELFYNDFAQHAYFHWTYH